jgi:hypothetical protein
MADDAVRAATGTISGVKFGDDPLTASNCTSNDVRIATATVTNYLLADADGNFTGTPIPFDSTTNVTCTQDQRIQLTMSAKLTETAASTRSDIGIWLATDGGKAITGSCNHYNLPTNPLPPGTGVSNADGDSCGDLNAGAVVIQVVNIWEAHPAFAEHIRRPELVEMVAQLCPTDALRVWHDQIQYKPPTVGTATRWHQDFPAWPVLTPGDQCDAPRDHTVAEEFPIH